MLRLPSISLVTPSYEQAEHLEACLRSVIDQDYPRLEYMVLDGGSTDGSVEIIRRHAHELDYWRSRPDEGQAEAINQGWGLAEGEVLGWLNSDDMLEPGVLSAVGRAFSKSEDARVVVGDCRVVNAEGRERRIERPEGYDLERQLLGKSLPQPSVFVHRSLVEATGGLDESLRYALDWDFFLRVFLRCGEGQVRYLPRCLSRSRVYGETKTRTGLSDKGDERRRVLEKLRSEGLLEPLSPSMYRRAVGGTYWVQAADEWMTGRTIDSLWSALRAFRRDPRRVWQAVSSLLWLVTERRRRRRDRSRADAKPEGLE